jgi:hypothetical protein
MGWRGLDACTEVKFLLPLQTTELWSYGFAVPLYLKAKSQGVLKEYDIHQDLFL